MTPEQADQNCALILRVIKGKPWVCIHTILAETKLPYKLALRHLSRLKELGKVHKVLMPDQDEMLVWGDPAYEPPDLTKIQPCDHEHVSVIVGLTEREARDRVIMLNRMKSRLICEWHPIIDIILRDYQRELTRIEGDLDFVVLDEDEK